MKRSYQSYSCDDQIKSQLKRKKCMDLAEYETDEQLIPIKYQGEWKIAGGKYKMCETERKEMKQLLHQQYQKEKKQLAVVLYAPLKIIPNIWTAQLELKARTDYQAMQLE